MKSDVILVGGGVVGLSLAWELSRRGVRVTLLERGELGQEASWAGAGILPPANRATAVHPYDQLRGLSLELYPRWSAQLTAETGIDNGFRACGGVYLATKAGAAAALHGLYGECVEQEIPARRLSAAEIAALEPALAVADVKAAYELPGECQLRNPRHLQALVAACRLSGVEFVTECEVVGWRTSNSRVTAVETTRGEFAAAKYCVTAGSWTQRLLAAIGVSTGIVPIRGQIILYKLPQRVFTRVINEGSRYLVARDDGYVLAGATEEEAGFDKSTTPEAFADLSAFALARVPALKDAVVERTWAGLRPGSFDSLPYLGRLPQFADVFVAAGHFRSGLYLSPATAVVMSQLLCDERPEIDLAPFGVLR